MATKKKARPMWTCPRCRHRFVTRNLWHSCVSVPLSHHFAGRPALRHLYRAWLRFVRQVGPVRVSSNRTRIAFMGRVRFGGCEVRKDHLRCSVALGRPVRDPRFIGIRQEVPGWWAHRFELRDSTQLDDRLLALVRESYREFGLRERLARPASSRASRAARRARA